MQATVPEAGLSRVRWSSVIAGGVLALGVQIALGLFGGALGIVAAGTGGGAGTAIAWNLAIPFVATLAGALIAVRSAGPLGRGSALLHGAIVWSLALIAGAVLLTDSLAGGLLSAASGGAAAGALSNLSEGDNAGAVAGMAAVVSTLAGVAAIVGLAGGLVGAAAGRRGEARIDERFLRAPQIAPPIPPEAPTAHEVYRRSDEGFPEPPASPLHH